MNIFFKKCIAFHTVEFQEISMKAGNLGEEFGNTIQSHKFEILNLNVPFQGI